MKNLYRNTLLVLIFICFLSVTGSIFFSNETAVRIFVIFADTLIAVGLIFLVLSFSKKLSKINNQLQIVASGSFTTDFPEKINNELDMLTFKLSKLFNNLNNYDRLRAKNVAKSAKAYMALTMNISEPVIMADFEENTASLNPAAQKIWNLETRVFPLDVVTKHAQNIEFRKFLERVVSSNEETADVSIYFPSASRREVSVKAVPIKTIDEKIMLILLFITTGDDKKENGK
ncbi:hypothetical protein KJ633_08060 [bacterium]|nr:hypothetical protein [bacterium]MBU3956401.1 hypothetical protein [bacterium]MBU4134345.1 hypothetical protein [bacterium]